MDTETESHGTESVSLVDLPFKIQTFKYKIVQATFFGSVQFFNF